MNFEKVSYSAFEKDMKKHGFGDRDIKQAYESIKLPVRKTVGSAGYDFCLPFSFDMKPGERVTIPSGIKIKFEPGTESKYWHCQLFVRSSTAIRRGVVLTNQTGIIDSDFYNCDECEGGVLIALFNTGYEVAEFHAGDRVMQAVFMSHGWTENDKASGLRVGGVGSTDKGDNE